MSVCLAVTKTIAVSSLGIYCGTLCSATILAQFTPMDVIKSQLMGPAKIVARVAASLATVSSIFFGLSFFGAPAHLRHPYLLYGMLVAPISSVYMALTMTFKRPRQCRERCTKRKAAEAAEAAEAASNATTTATTTTTPTDVSLDESVVDLGQLPVEDETLETTTTTTTTRTPDHAPETLPFSPVTCHSSKCLRPIPVLFAISVAGFAESVLGLYGEGLFV
ncbi:LAME_0A06832g1_1 [Lachancea meyersii CBS 8951]|uniref:LAME_0A06832g1_1 n=1 Tax=Lachancea meyersii CBS 8951 TaxID=1266667 RepID=A0A1G4IQN8_9SACH|nr:LAME_0A06832g1_1 [Lachancea meyersii CBS 8951]